MAHLRLVAIGYDAEDPVEHAAFWAALLGRQVVEDGTGALLAGGGGQVGLRFVAGGPRRDRNQAHLHLTSSTPEDQRRIVEQALRLGGHHLDVGQLPDEEHVVLADPSGNAFCVIEPQNRFLAGCGPLGEVTIREGTRQVGLFWRDALGWPLVWDRDEETAIQSPQGGTKISWGGEPVAPTRRTNRVRYELAGPAVDTEVERLTALGATVIGDTDHGIELTDPDGNPFSITLG